MRFVRPLLIALALSVAPMAAVVATAPSAAAHHDGDHSGYECYTTEAYRYSTWVTWGSATYYTDYYDTHFECFEPASGTYWWHQTGTVGYSYWVFED